MRRKSGFPFIFCYIAIPTGFKDGLPLRNQLDNQQPILCGPNANRTVVDRRRDAQYESMQLALCVRACGGVKGN